MGPAGSRPFSPGESAPGDRMDGSAGGSVVRMVDHSPFSIFGFLRSG
jgi:hypothetical protein